MTGRALRRLCVAAVVLAASRPALAGDPLPNVVIRALETSNHRAAVSALEEAATTTTDPTQLAWIELYAGEERRLCGDLAAARVHFERVAGTWPAHRAKNPAVLGMAVVDAGSAASGNTLATLGLIADDNVPDTMNADRYLLLARARWQEGATEAEVTALTRRAQGYAAADKDVSRRLSKSVAELTATPAPTGATPPPLPTSGPADLAAILQVRTAIAAARWPDARSLASTYAQRFPDSPYVREAAYAVRRADAGVATDPKKVVVLLPLSGSYAPPALNLKAAMELANSQTRSPAALVFVDTAGKAEQCVAALEKAVIEQGAAIAIGPLLKEEAIACAPAAQALHVPMVVLTTSAEPLGAGDQIFHTWASTEAQIAALLDEAQVRRGYSRFAVMSPKTSYGENAARAFEAAVKQRGGSVVHSATYAPDTNDFRAAAKAVGKPAGATTVDYDALFIPDGYQHVALIAAALAFAEIPVGHFRPHSSDTPITLLGLNAWNNDDLARRGGAYVEDSIFVDAFDTRSADPATVAFVTAWNERGAGAPSAVEAIGYDTLRIVHLAQAQGGDPAQALARVRLPDPVSGLRGFDASRDAERDWRLLTVTRDGIAPLGGIEPTAPAPPQ